MDVQVSGTRGKRGDGWAQAGLALLLLSAVLAPGFAWPPWFRILATLLLIGLALIVGRAYLAAFLTFRRPKTPPEKPVGTEWPRLSVIVPAYNEASVLPRTMQSMLRIDYPADKLEFIYVYEKRCTDGTGQVIQAFAARDARFRAVERDERKGGKAAAWNAGLRHATGDIIVSLDADHELKPDAAKRAVRHFLADPRLMCLKGRCIGINEGESFLALQSKLERDMIEKGDIFMRHLVGGFTFFGGGQAFFRRSVFGELGPFDEEILVEDIDFSVLIHKAGHRLAVDPLVVSYEEHPAVLSAWWAQRKRWARGWMQVATRYLPGVGGMRNLRWTQKLDLAHTLAYVLVPIFFVVGAPLLVLGQLGFSTSDYLWPASVWLWASFAAAPFVAWGAMRAQDRRDGIPHPSREWLGVPFLWGYLIFQTVVFWNAFLEEFVLRRPSVYVKTEKSGEALPVAPLLDRMIPVPPTDVSIETRAQGKPMVLVEQD